MSEPSITEAPSPRRVTRLAAVPFLLGALLASFCYTAAGPTLGLFFGATIFAAVLLPPMILAHDGWTPRILSGGAVVDGVAVIWLVAVFRSPVTFVQWLECYFVLAAFATTLLAAAVLLERARVHRVLASAVVVFLALAWLGWPVWLSPWLNETLAGWLTPAHPLLTLNGVLKSLGIWGEQSLAYHLTNLGQHVRYDLPDNILRAVTVHLLLAAAMLLGRNSLPAAGAPSDRRTR